MGGSANIQIIKVQLIFNGVKDGKDLILLLMCCFWCLIDGLGESKRSQKSSLTLCSPISRFLW